MPIRHITVHHIHKTPNGSVSELSMRDTELPESACNDDLLSDLNESYNSKQGKAWGFFHAESGAHPLSGWLGKYLDGGTDFMTFSKQAVQHLQKLIRYLANVKYLCYEIQTFRNSGVLRPLNVPSSA